MKLYVEIKGEQYEVSDIFTVKGETLIEYQIEGDANFMNVKKLIGHSIENKPETLTNWGTEMHETLDIGCGTEIALDDYWEMDENGDEKTEFTFDEVKEIEKSLPDGWRLPTPQEWIYIVAEYGCKNGVYDYDTFVKNLSLTTDKTSRGYYWSSAVGRSNLGCYLYFDSSFLDPQNHFNHSRFNWFSVRLVRGA